MLLQLKATFLEDPIKYYYCILKQRNRVLEYVKYACYISISAEGEQEQIYRSICSSTKVITRNINTINQFVIICL